MERKPAKVLARFAKPMAPRGVWRKTTAFRHFMEEELRRENELLKRKLRAALHVTTESTLDYLLRYDEWLKSGSSLPYTDWLKGV